MFRDTSIDSEKENKRLSSVLVDPELNQSSYVPRPQITVSSEGSSHIQKLVSDPSLNDDDKLDVPIRRKSSASLVENALKKRLSASMDEDVVDKKKEENIEERDTRRRYTVGSSVLLGSTAHGVAPVSYTHLTLPTKA